MGLDPKNQDLDDDGFLDGVELAAETDPQNKDELPIGEGVSLEPLIADTTGDSDGDGLTDGEEANLFGTDPSLSLIHI